MTELMAEVETTSYTGEIAFRIGDRETHLRSVEQLARLWTVARSAGGWTTDLIAAERQGRETAQVMLAELAAA